MRTRILLMGLLLAAVANAQTIYHDASAFPLLGKATESTLTSYERLPEMCIRDSGNSSLNLSFLCCYRIFDVFADEFHHCGHAAGIFGSSTES